MQVSQGQKSGQGKPICKGSEWLETRVDSFFHLAYVLAYAKEVIVIPERHVKLFKNGRNQAVRIPREFELPGKDALMRKEGDRLIIEPARPKSLLALLAMLRPLDEEFPPIPELPVDSVEL